MANRGQAMIALVLVLALFLWAVMGGCLVGWLEDEEERGQDE